MEQQPSAAGFANEKANLDHLFVPAYEIREYLHVVFSLIAQRAYEIFESRGKVSGHDWEDWFRAESEVLRQVSYELEDAGDALVAVAAVDNYSPEDLRISVEPLCLRIWGLLAANGRQSEASREDRQTFQPFFVSLNLPVAINASSSSADIRHGILEVRLPKALSHSDA